MWAFVFFSLKLDVTQFSNTRKGIMFEYIFLRHVKFIMYPTNESFEKTLINKQ